MPSWHVYIVRCADKSLYTGVSTDVARRVGQHDDGTGAAYTRGRGPVALAWSEPAKSRSAALKREARIKKLSREGKLALCYNHSITKPLSHSSPMAKGNHAQQKNKKKPKKDKKK